jgi:hypothetical protein
MAINKDGNQAGKRKPIDHLRAFVASVMEPCREKEASEINATTEQEPKKPFRGRDVALGSGEDKTLKFILGRFGYADAGQCIFI